MNPVRQEIESHLRVEARENGFRALLNVDPGLSVLPDHFQGFPLLPGVCLMQAVLIAGAIRQGVVELRVSLLKNAKMTQPVRPGDQIEIEAEMTAGREGDFLI